MIIYRYQRESDGFWLGKDGNRYSSARRAARRSDPGEVPLGAKAVRFDFKPHKGPRAGTGLGLQELIERSKPGECPLCGEPTMPKWKKPKKTHRLLCGDEVCVRAYQIYYGRDRRRKEQASR